MSQFVDDKQLLDLMEHNKLFYCTNDDGNNYRYLAPYRALQTPKSNSKSKSKSNVTKKTSSVSKSSYIESKIYTNLFEKSSFNPKYVEKDNQRKYVDHSNKGQRILKKDGIDVSVENIIILTLMSKTNRGSVRMTIETIKNLNHIFEEKKADFQKVDVNTIDDLIMVYIKKDGNVVEVMKTLAPPKEGPKKGLNKSAKNSNQSKATVKGTVKGTTTQPKATTAQPKSNKTSLNTNLDINGKNIVVTGFNKDVKIGKIIKDNGGILKQSVSNKVDLVIAKDINSETRKIKDAREKSIEIISLANLFPSHENE